MQGPEDYKFTNETGLKRLSLKISLFYFMVRVVLFDQIS